MHLDLLPKHCVMSNDHNPNQTHQSKRRMLHIFQKNPNCIESYETDNPNCIQSYKTDHPITNQNRIHPSRNWYGQKKGQQIAPRHDHMAWPIVNFSFFYFPPDLTICMAPFGMTQPNAPYNTVVWVCKIKAETMKLEDCSRTMLSRFLEHGYFLQIEQFPNARAAFTTCTTCITYIWQYGRQNSGTQVADPPINNNKRKIK